VRVFVAWDFSDIAAHALLDGCCGSTDGLPDGQNIEWLVPGITLGAAGVIGSDIVEKGIREADRVIALVDHANANVGWEAGYAIGLGIPVSFGVLRPKPTWAERGALAGLYLESVHGPEDLLKLVLAPKWAQPRLADVKSAPSTSNPNLPLYVLCPGGIEGANLRKRMQRSFGAQLRLAPEPGNTLVELPSVISGCRQALWVICTHTEAGGVDGPSNASNALIAGILRGWAVPLLVLRSSKARTLADVAGESRHFNGIDGFHDELRNLLAVGGMPLAGPELPHRIEVPAGLDASRLQTLLQTRFPERSSQIQPLAAMVDIENLTLDATTDQLWYEILRQASHAHTDIRPLVQALLVLEPDNAFLLGLAGL
jgi:hypothetical protein